MTSILVVEDEGIIATDIRFSLERAGYRVPRIAATGEDAVRVARELAPDLIMMDIRLAGPMDGVEAAMRIRAERHVPLVFLTAHSDDATLERARKAHPYGFLLKPLNDRELRTTIEMALYKSRHDRALAEQEQWLRTTLRAIGEGVIATDADGRVRLVNPVAEELTGWSMADALGRELADIFALADTATNEMQELPVVSALRERKRISLPANTEIVSRNGRRVPIEDSASPILNDQGAVLGAVLVFRDIGERRDLERRLAAASRLASIGTLAAGVAHEVNNPLCYAIGNLEFVGEQLDGISASGEFRETRAAIAEALEGTRRVARIVGDLRHFARGASSNDDNGETAVDIASAIDLALKHCSAETHHRAQVRVELVDPPLIRANEGRLCQVLVNLITNAAHAMPDGRRLEENEIQISARATANGGANIDICDNGRGIPVSVLPRIFDPFFTTKDVGAGTGLGLSVSHGIVTAMGGTIEVESIEDGGSVFRVFLPGAHPYSVKGPSHRGAVTEAKRGRILLVDDEPAIVRALSRVLRREHEVATALSGDEALALIDRDRRFDVIVCDLMMPGINGMDLVERLERELPEQARRVVLISGGTVTERAKEFVASTPNRFLEKPLGIDALREVIRTMLE